MRRLMLAAAALIVSFAGVGLVGASPSAESVHVHWVIRDLGTLGGKESHAVAVNSDDQILGRSRTSTGATHAFMWEHGTMTDLGTVGAYRNSWPVAINDRGQIVAGSSSGDEGFWYGAKTRAFLWQNGQITDLGTLDGYRYSWPAAINNRGQIVGVSIGDVHRKTLSRAFLWQDGRLRDLGGYRWRGQSDARAINSAGEVAGSCSVKGPHAHAVLWRGRKILDLGTLRGLISTATEINDRGQVAGWSGTATHQTHAVLWDNGKMLDLTPDARGESARAINARGQVLVAGGVWDSGDLKNLQGLNGSAINDRGQVVGCIFRGDLNVLPALWENGRLTVLPKLSHRDSCAEAINNHDQIVGEATTKSGQTHAVLWALKTDG